MENDIFKKIDTFISNYYLNKIKKGIFIYLFFSIIGISFFSFLEYFNNFSRIQRTIIFSFLILFNFIELYRHVFIWVLRKFKIFPSLSREEASQLIGNKDVIIKDKLLNIVQLHQYSKNPFVEEEIKIRNKFFNKFVLEEYINKTNLRRWMLYFFTLFSITIATFFLIPDIYKNGIVRIFSINKDFKQSMPFDFEILNKKLEVIQGNNFTLNLSVFGNNIPDKVYFVSNNNRRRMNKIENDKFQIELKAIQESLQFYFTDNEFTFGNNILKVINIPKVFEQNITIIPPKYTKINKVEIKTWKDISIPKGSKVIISCNGINIESIIDSTKYIIFSKKNNYYSVSKQIFDSKDLNIKISSHDFSIYEKLNWNIIEDNSPSINFQMTRDSIDYSVVRFNGTVSDDYGIKNVNLKWRKKGEKNWKSEKITITKNMKGKQDFFHAMKFDKSQEMEFQAEVLDNDEINGNKLTKTETFKLYEVSKYEKQQEQNDYRENFIDKANEIMASEQMIKEQMEDIFNKLKLGEKLDWQDKEQIKNLINQSKNNYDNLKELNNEFKRTNNFTVDENIIKKQKQLEELADNLLDENMKKQIQKMQEMLDKLAKNKEIENELKNLEQNNDNLEKNLDRNIELFKRFDVEQKMDNIAKKLKDLAKEQEKLANTSTDIKKDQEKIEEKFNELKKEMDDLKKKNEELKNPLDLTNQSEKEKAVEENSSKAKENLENKRKSKANENQKKVQKKIEEIAEQMEQDKKNNEEKMTELNMEMLQQILENLLYLSFEQEDIIYSSNKYPITNPLFIKTIRNQKLNIEKTKIVEDSLYSLSKQLIMMKSTIQNELTNLKQQQELSIKSLYNRNKSKATLYQKKSLTNINNLALMLNELLNQMQNSSNNPSKGDKQQKSKQQGGMPKPGGQSMQSLQKQLSEQMKSLKEQMGKEGQGKNKGKGFSKQFAKMAAQQSMLRQQMISYQQSKSGKNCGTELSEQIIKEMEKTEEDLLNKNITTEILKRQKDILSKLLEEENAEREREYDNKRESKTVENSEIYQIELKKYKLKKLKELELLETTPAELNEYYKNISKIYLNK